MPIERDLITRLQALLRRDPRDLDAAFVISVLVRDPFVVYASERRRLALFLAAEDDERARTLAAAAEVLLRG